MIRKKAAVQAEVVPTPEPLVPRMTRILLSVLFRPRLLFLIAVAATSLVCLPRITRWLPALEQRPEYQRTVQDIDIGEQPKWIPFDFVNQVAERAGLGPEFSVLDEDWTGVIAEAFRLHPWVRDVKSVRRADDRRILVELEFRVPIAMVEVNRGVYPIDAQGVLLPPSDFTVADTRRFCLIRNVQTTPQGPAGTEWGDVVVRGAARLAAVLSATSDQSISHWRRLRLAAIEVPRRTRAQQQLDDLLYEIRTQSGSRIQWGRAPGTAHPGELSADQKIGRLQKYLLQLDTDGGGPYEIDIRHWREITYQPLTASGPRRSLLR